MQPEQLWSSVDAKRENVNVIEQPLWGKVLMFLFPSPDSVVDVWGRGVCVCVKVEEEGK